MSRLIRIPKSGTIDLTDFEGTKIAGAVITVLAEISTGRLFDLQAGVDSKIVSAVRESIKIFGDEVLCTWNLAGTDGKALPATSDGMLILPPSLSALIFERWSEEISGVPKGSLARSSDGNTSAAPSTNEDE